MTVQLMLCLPSQSPPGLPFEKGSEHCTHRPVGPPTTFGSAPPPIAPPPGAANIGDGSIVGVSAAHDWIGSRCASRCTMARISGERSAGPAAAVPAMLKTIIAVRTIHPPARHFRVRAALRHSSLVLMKHSSADDSDQIARTRPRNRPQTTVWNLL